MKKLLFLFPVFIVAVMSFDRGIRIPRMTTAQFRATNEIPRQFNPVGDSNLLLGRLALRNNTSGIRNTAIGIAAMVYNTTGSFNTTCGLLALPGNVSGSQNVALGLNAGYNNITGSMNTFIGTQSHAGVDGLTNATAIGYNSVVSQSNSLVLGGTGTNEVKVGIGTSAPREKLDIRGAITINDAGYGGVGNNAGVPIPAGGPGTIIFSNGHFLGWNGTRWKQLDN